MNAIQKIRQTIMPQRSVKVMHGGEEKVLLKNLNACNALEAIGAVELIKRKHPKVEGILLTKTDADALFKYVIKNRENRAILHKYYYNFFDKHMWLGTISAHAAKDIPLWTALQNGYLVGKHNITTRTGFYGLTQIEKEYSWKFPVDEAMLKERGYSHESKNIIFLLDLIAGGKITYVCRELNRTYTMEILKPEHVQIIDREKTIVTLYYGQNAYVGLISYSIIATGENEMKQLFFMPDPEFMHDRNFISKSPDFDKIVLNGQG